MCNFSEPCSVWDSAYMYDTLPYNSITGSHTKHNYHIRPIIKMTSKDVYIIDKVGKVETAQKCILKLTMLLVNIAVFANYISTGSAFRCT